MKLVEKVNLERVINIDNKPYRNLVYKMLSTY